MKNVLRLLVIDDEARVRTGLRMRLASEPDLLIVGEAGDVQTALLLARQVQPDVIVIDLVLAGEDGIAAIATLRSIAPDAVNIAFSVHEDGETRRAAFAAGAAAFIAKQEGPERLLEVIRTCAWNDSQGAQADNATNPSFPPSP